MGYGMEGQGDCGVVNQTIHNKGALRWKIWVLQSLDTGTHIAVIKPSKRKQLKPMNVSFKGCVGN
jgi:hypothetical protein